MATTETERMQDSMDPETKIAAITGGIHGAIGGLVATVVMTAYRLPVARSLPPTAVFWEQYVGNSDAEEYPIIGLFLHLGYGVTGGVVFGALYGAVGNWRAPDYVQESRGILSATVYGLALSLFGSRVVLGRLLGMDLDADESLVFHLSHVIYALTLGTWVGSRVGVER